jgi:hypothetical protein
MAAKAGTIRTHDLLYQTSMKCISWGRKQISAFVKKKK